ncbi:putative ILV1-anabolic serine and threonine dehydratase precursor [Tilletiaria anomala UBC 951]|uniref:Threonine dehydratase n=1 Tax=Tilletiaria anomala (strain ATCC 24038 / CBS 436.72 / UBC 951) TaxID=1037660 RepID=A0A066W7I9_TILAU|nr:putative ILV1-anabolic serine and threonine dehydratase precursor [Tilletiaria anomala UBC 951]KDN48503.1 putative ILV1-anabolic serine and threonine dehydratase precursor [Tilletiaria anomala UBC 951]
MVGVSAPNESARGFAAAAGRASYPWHQYVKLPPHHLQPDGTPDYLRMILSADIYSLVKQTPLSPAVNMSTKLGCNILMKREDLQPVFSFKLRGAFNMMRQLSEEQKWKGVIACSAGNHAQGVAMSGAHLSVPCTIVMPVATPTIKTANVARLGAKVVLHGNDFDEAKAECFRLAEQYGLAIIPPFDDPQVIAGQGTVGVEVCRQTDMSKVDAVFCCVGGGGLLAGVAAYVKRIAPPHVKVIGVETYDADALTRSLEIGTRVTLDEVGLFADGTAVKIIGEETFRVCEDLVDGMVRVDNDAICAAIRDVFEDTRSIPEPSGALAVAGMKEYIRSHGLQGSGKTFISVVSGANMNFGRLRFVAERAELGERREALLHVEIPEKAGSFLELHSHINPRPLTEFSYRYHSDEVAHVFLSFFLDGKAPASSVPASAGPVNPAAATPQQTAALQDLASGKVSAAVAATEMSSQAAEDAQANAPAGSMPLDPREMELQNIMANIRASGMRVTDISANEMAKTHARYLVGGRCKVPNERLFRFEFPERPGALRKFLLGLRVGWNVSLWHYRNHGADIGRVLAGLQVPSEDHATFQHWLDHELGYVYVEETSNPVYQRFLCAE